MFITELVVARDMHERNLWVVKSPLVWDDGTNFITVPVGFKFDFCSVPTLLQGFIPRSGMFYDRATCLHDWLYGTWITDRKEADRLFYEAMLDDHVPKSRAWIMYRAVRAFGGSAWRGRTIESVQENRILGGLPRLAPESA